MRKTQLLTLDRRYAPAESVNDLLEGVPVSAYTDSGGYVGLSAPSGGTLYPYCSVNYIDRIQRRLKNPAGVPGNNNAVVGAQMNEVAMYAISTQTAASRKGTAVAGTWTPSALPSGIVIVEAVLNDVIHYAQSSTGSRGTDGFQNALDGLIRYLRSKSLLQDTNAAFAYTGTWTSGASSAVPGGNSHYSSTNGNSVTVTTPTGTDFDLCLLGWDDTHAGGTSAAFTVQVDGANFGITGYPFSTGSNGGTQSQQCYQGLAVGVGFNSTPLVIPVHGLSNATHTIKITHNDTTGRNLWVSQLWTPSPTPPTIIVQKAAYMTAAAYTATGVTAAMIDQFNGYIDTVVARFPSDGSIVVTDPNKSGWDPTTMISSQDSNGVHANDLGQACWADMTLRALANAPGLRTRNGLLIL